MKTTALIVLTGMSWVAGLYGQAQPPKTVPPSPPPPPPVVTHPPPTGSSEKYVYEQKPLAGRPYLVTPEQAQNIINRFKEAHVAKGSPRILIYVNRDLVDEESGLKLSARSQQTESVRGDQAALNRQGAGATNAKTLTGAEGIHGQTDRVTNKNTFRIRDAKPTPLADRQTMRDVERLFGRPLRLGGATLVDQRVATQMLPGKTLDNFSVSTEGEQARKDREALAKVADVVLEVLISSRNVTVSEISGEKIYSVPDIQATAIRLSDSKILGQATASDLVGQDRAAARVVRSFGVRDITEATALSLMEDMLQ